jgi:hypothetical protein
LYSIPEARQTAIGPERLVTAECVCRVDSGEVGSTQKEKKPMDNKMYGMVEKVFGWLKKRSFILVLLMSIFHVGLAYIHTRDSGRADPLTNF